MTAYLSEKVPVSRGLVYFAGGLLLIDVLDAVFKLLTAFSHGLMGY